ncbi:NAD(P)/FAD-dependent oxidoreductase [Actinomycetospora sp. CA-053990]|uniref:NAD(P)/FAD-dependent oxidoreductase n=1 Tax=Actinomycetospora sp. CA-053990 TaxID=3239891 RepID=UPI003D943182
MSTPKKRVLVIGAGYAGATVAVRLAGRSRGRTEVTVVNPRPQFVNRLRLHHVATGRAVPAPDLRRMLGAGATLVEGHVTTLDPDAGRATVTGPDGVRILAFDRVVVATGSTTAAAPVPGGQLVHAVADLASAHRLRTAFAALPAGTPVSVVGGGFTGLETVAELAESRPDVPVRLVTAGEVGGWFTPQAAEHVRRTLEELGVEALGGTRVRAVAPDRLVLDDGAEVPSGLTVWCGGFAAPRWPATPGSPWTTAARSSPTPRCARCRTRRSSPWATPGTRPHRTASGSACPASSRSRRPRTPRTRWSGTP